MITSEPPILVDKPAPTRPSRPRPKSSPAAVIGLYLIIVFIGAALISPRLYASAQFLESISYRFSFLADAPFHRFVNRCLILLALLGLPSLFKALGLRSAAVLGLNFSPRHWVESFQGFAWAFVSLAVLAALLVTSEVRVLDLDHDSARWMRHLKNATISALLVGLLEELLFRGALFGTLRQTKTFWRAALLSSVLYALLHFLDKPIHSGRVEWHSGFAVLAQMLRGFTDWQIMIPAFLNLTLIGCLLALVFERSGSLLFSIGLHAGFVFWLKSFVFLTNASSPALSRFWGSDKLIDGWATTIVLLLILLLIERTLPPRKEIAT